MRNWWSPVSSSSIASSTWPNVVSAYLPPKLLLETLPAIAAKGCDELWLNPGTDTPDVIAAADWVVDLGPDGGPDGGRIIAQGTPEEVARERGSRTGVYLKQALARR